MKCLCGYERLDQWKLEDRKEKEPDFKNGEEDFITSENSIRFEVRPSGYGDDGTENEYLYACPKCGTIKIEL